MKKNLPLITLVCLLLSACALGGPKTTAVIPLNLEKPITLSNQDFDLEVFQVYEIYSKEFGDRTISLQGEAKNTHTLYEMQMRYTNHLDGPASLSYKRLKLSLPGVEDPGKDLIFAGYCLQGIDAPGGEPERCAAVPTTKPGVYGVTGVFLMDTYSPPPGESSEIYFIFAAENSQDRVELSFIEPEE